MKIGDGERVADGERLQCGGIIPFQNGNAERSDGNEDCCRRDHQFRMCAETEPGTTIIVEEIFKDEGWQITDETNLAWEVAMENREARPERRA